MSGFPVILSLRAPLTSEGLAVNIHNRMTPTGLLRPRDALGPGNHLKLELQMPAGAYLFPSKYLLSRISGDCACPVR
jgi:hypothetical protein